MVAVPPLRDFYRTTHRHSALGARIVQQILLEHGWSTSFFNFPEYGKRGLPLPLPGELSYLSPFLIPEEKGGLSFFTRFQHFGPSFSDCGEMIIREKPDILFLQCFAFCYADETLALAREVFSRDPGIKICIGGPGAAVLPAYFIRDGCVSTVFLGEIEDSLPGFLKGEYSEEIIQSNPGTIYPSFAVCRETKSSRQIAVSLTRGCPKSCRFCSVHLSQGRKFRKAEISSVEKMADSMPKDKRAIINIEDDNILADMDYCLEILALFRKYMPLTEFWGENGIDYTFLDKNRVMALYEAGMSRFNLSLGTLQASGRKEEARPGGVGKYEGILETLNSLGVPVTTYFICGLRSDTPETIAETLLYLAAKPTLLGISLFYAVPGLPDFTNKTQFLSQPPRLGMSSSAYPWNGSLTTEESVTAFRLSRFINLLKKPSKTGDEKKLISIILKTGRLHTLIKENPGYSCIPVPKQSLNLCSSVIPELRQMLDKGYSLP